MYTATITNKKIVDGKFVVEVLFSNDIGQNFTETFQTTQFQEGGWIGKLIKRRLDDLNSLPELNDLVPVGPYVEESPVKTEGEIYKEKAELYNRYVSLARAGYIESDRPIILSLRAWLRENFKDEYVVFF